MTVEELVEFLQRENNAAADVHAPRKQITAALEENERAVGFHKACSIHRRLAFDSVTPELRDAANRKYMESTANQ